MGENEGVLAPFPSPERPKVGGDISPFYRGVLKILGGATSAEGRTRPHCFRLWRIGYPSGFRAGHDMSIRYVAGGPDGYVAARIKLLRTSGIRRQPHDFGCRPRRENSGIRGRLRPRSVILACRSGSAMALTVAGRLMRRWRWVDHR